MPMNDMTISQASTVLNSIVQQAGNRIVLTPITTPEDFVSVAQTALKTGYDPIINAISQVWSRTVFAVRDYDKRILGSLYMDLPRYGNAVRKLSPIARDMINDDSYLWPVAYDSTQTPPMGDGQSVDHYTIYKQQVQQVNFYGTAVYEQAYTIFKDQFDTAFGSMDEFVRFNAMNLTERNNEKTQYEENLARGLQANLIASLIDEADTYRVVHLLTEYNTVTGQTTPLTATTVMQAGNFEAFIRWLYSKVANIVRLMGERSNMFQTIINSQNVLRHSSPDNIRVAMLSPFMDYINSMVLATTYHDDYMKLPTYEAINFWQSIQNPSTVSMTPVYTDSTGAVASSSAVAQTGVIGVIHDRDAIGYTITNPVSAVTPLNAKGLYWDEYYHARFKTVYDNTEKAVVLVLD